MLSSQDGGKPGLSLVGFLERRKNSVGEGTLASPSSCSLNRNTLPDGRRKRPHLGNGAWHSHEQDEGDASVPSPPSPTPAPTEFLRLSKNLSVIDRYSVTAHILIPGKLR